MLLFFLLIKEVDFFFWFMQINKINIGISFAIFRASLKLNHVTDIIFKGYLNNVYLICLVKAIMTDS